MSDNEDIGDKFKLQFIGATGAPRAPIAENRGQLFQSQMRFRWVETGPTIEAGSKIE
jgi:hypothetical protein